MRGVAAIVVGLIVGLVALSVVGFIGGMLFPPEQGMQIKAGADFGRVFEALPVGAKLAAILSWTAGAFAGGAVAKLIARRPWAAWLVAGAFLVLAAANFTILPMPAWMQALGVVGPVLGGWLAGRVPVRDAPAHGFAEEEDGDGAQV